MDVKIQELTDKIYREGVEKGNEEANRIVAEANARKQSILHDAEEEAARLVAAAEKQAAAVKKSAESELKLFAAQFLEGFKSEVANVITGKIVTSNIQPLATDPLFVQKMVLEMAKEWAKEGGSLTIQSSATESLVTYFEANAKELLLQGGVHIEKIIGKPTSFTITPADGTFKVAFGEEEFLAFFAEFLRPQLMDLLF